MICDAHCDLPTKLYDEKKSLLQNDCHWSLEKAPAAFVQVFAHWIDQKTTDDPFFRADQMLDETIRQLAIYADQIAPATCYSDIVRNQKNGLRSAFLSIEGGEALNGEIKNIDYFYQKGVRFLTLTWNYENELGFGVGEHVANRGLKPFGKKVVERMRKIGMCVDVSHLSEKGFWDVAEIMEQAPFWATHSNAFAMHPHRRNLTDEQIRHLIKCRGFIGLNFYPLFLTSTDTASCTDILRHMEHFLSLGAEDILGFGGDFDGIDVTPKDIRSVADYETLLLEMQKLNYSEEIIAKIAQNNFINGVKRIFK